MYKVFRIVKRRGFDVDRITALRQRQQYDFRKKRGMRDAGKQTDSAALIRPPATLRSHHHTVVHTGRHVFVVLPRIDVLVVAHP